MEKNIAILVWTSHTYETWHIEFQFFQIFITIRLKKNATLFFEHKRGLVFSYKKQNEKIFN